MPKTKTIYIVSISKINSFWRFIPHLVEHQVYIEFMTKLLIRNYKICFQPDQWFGPGQMCTKSSNRAFRISYTDMLQYSITRQLKCIYVWKLRRVTISFCSVFVYKIWFLFIFRFYLKLHMNNMKWNQILKTKTEQKQIMTILDSSIS